MRWLSLLLVAGLIGGAAFLYHRDHRPAAAAKSPTGPAAPRSDTAAPRIFAGGAVEGARPEIVLRFESPGTIKAVRVRAGERVEAGALLVELESQLADLRCSDARSQLKIAVAERDRLVNLAVREGRDAARLKIRTAEKQLRDAETLLTRGRQQARQNAVSVQDLEDLKQQFEQAGEQLKAVRQWAADYEPPLPKEELAIAEAKVALAETEVQRARILLDKTRLVAPVAGVVLVVAAEPGDLADPRDDRGAVTLVDRSRTQVRAFVEELDALRVAVGAKAAVTADGRPGQSCAGTVAWCAPSLRPKTQRHFKPGERLDLQVREILIDLADGDDLLIGLPVEVFITPLEPGQTPPPAPYGKSPRLTVRPERTIRNAR